MEDDENDDLIDDLMFNLLVKEVGVAEEKDAIEGEEYPMTTDGSRERKVRRNNYDRGPKEKKSNDDPATTIQWMRWIADPAIAFPHTAQGKRFRHLFRIPFPIFTAIVKTCKESGNKLFNYAVTDAAGQYSIPVEVKILFSIRVLAGGMKVNDAAELTQFMSNSTGNSFFTQFVVDFADMFEHIHIRPLEGEELLRSMASYARLGLAGCLGSIDATIFPWGKCSKEMHNACDGDKGVGVLFEVVVTHEKLILAVGGPFPSTINDKISVKYSEFMAALKSKVIASNIKYRLRTGPGVDDFIELSAVYVIADGGYLQWPQIICGYPYSSDPFKYRFSDWVASVRKDVECLFGILKMRFFYLKHPAQVQSGELLRAIFVTCCILNNMIMRADGLDTLWESDVNWSAMNDSAEEDHEEEDVDAYMPVQFDPATFQTAILADMEPLDFHGQLDEVEHDFHTLRDLLARHLHFTYASGNLRWPKVRKHCVDKGVDLNQIIRLHFPGAGDDIV